MGLSSRFALHARDRDGADREHDHREASPVQRGRRRRSAAGLIAALLAAPAASDPLRVGVFHAELNRDGPGLLLRDIRAGDPQVAAVLNVIRHADVDVLVLAGIDMDAGRATLSALNAALGNAAYPVLWAGATNRGRATGLDLDGDGRFGEAEDAVGYGAFPGAKATAILSRLPLEDDIADLTDTRWADLPGGLHAADLPDLPLSTTMHWDLPLRLPDGQTIRLWTWHATAPVFDGPEDMNGRRNRDEAYVWLHRLDETPRDMPVIVAGVANLDPVDGDGRPDALTALLQSPRLQDPRPASDGGRAAADTDHEGDPALDTADWPDERTGNLRVDYVLPGAAFEVQDAGVLWPSPGSDLDELIGDDVRTASRHRLVWVDLVLRR